MPTIPKLGILSLAPLIGILASVALIVWEAGHGGVRTHHLLARGDMPGISNWWGVLVLPLLGWFTSFLIRRRKLVGPELGTGVLLAFLGALVIGVLLAVLFHLGLESATSTLFFGVFALGLILPIYRAEYVFGYVIGMSFVFGPVIPILAASVVASFSALTRLLVFPGLAFTFRKVTLLLRG